MTEQAINYDDVKRYRLDSDREQQLLNNAGECTFIWANKTGHPLGVTTAYVAAQGKIWMTATRQRLRIKAIARDGRSAIVISSKGTSMGGGKSVTYKGHTIIHEEQATKLWLYDLLAQAMLREQQHDPDNSFTTDLDAAMFIRFLDTPERVVLEFTPEMSIPFDGDKMAAGTAQAYAEFAAADAKKAKT
jgi:hypothetical protein